MPTQVVECPCVDVGPRPSWNIQVYIVSENCMIYIAVSEEQYFRLRRTKARHWYDLATFFLNLNEY